MSPEAVNSPALATPPGYSHAMRAGGLLFVSGQVPFDEGGAVVGVGDMRAQAEQTFRNLGIVLEAAGASFADLVKLTYFVRDVSAVAEVRAARDLFVDVTNPPASSLVEVSALIHPDLLIEIEAVAELPAARLGTE
ncbi:RidA family protein [Catenuloplanes indicus]|uniref:Reactive intermediate/imine deaminase n=1 Tax=Catenuloplanes indicus TaxID=137267 RepID=A0AAE3VXP2_9ACTN|nr:RidA family protein [Catenuloplanes indicus]MDQ0365502.1 reactive intermediate/imine deaminase [Catenuloplanes indicus]